MSMVKPSKVEFLPIIFTQFQFQWRFLLVIFLDILPYNWRLPSPSELTPILFNMELTQLGSKASRSSYIFDFIRSKPK